MRYYPLRVPCLVLAVAGCHAPKAADKENFAKAVTAFFDKNCAMLTPTTPSIFGTAEPHPLPVDIDVAPMADSDLPRYDALAQAGCLGWD